MQVGAHTLPSCLDAFDADDDVRRCVTVPTEVANAFNAMEEGEEPACLLAFREWARLGLVDYDLEDATLEVATEFFRDALARRINEVPESAEDIAWVDAQDQDMAEQTSVVSSIAPSDSASVCSRARAGRIDLLNALETCDFTALTDHQYKIAQQACPFGRHLFCRSRENRPVVVRTYFNPLEMARAPQRTKKPDLEPFIPGAGTFKACYVVNDIPYTRQMLADIRPQLQEADFPGFEPDVILRMVQATYGCSYDEDCLQESDLGGNRLHVFALNFARYADPLNKPLLMLVACSRQVDGPARIAGAKAWCHLEVGRDADPCLFFNSSRYHLIPNAHSGVRDVVDPVPLGWFTEHRLQTSEEYALCNQATTQTKQYMANRCVEWASRRYTDAPLAPFEESEYVQDTSHGTTRGSDRRSILSAPGVITSTPRGSLSASSSTPAP